MPRGKTPTPAPDDRRAATTRELRDVALTIVNTGYGKGKTTAALGTAMRTWAAGGSVGVFQFVKSGRWRTGEHQIFDLLAQQRPGSVEWQILGQGFSWLRTPFSESDKARAALEGWEYVADGIRNARHDLWLLDEFTYPMTWGWVDPDEVVDVLTHRPGKQHVIITGRNCPAPIFDIADLITNMTKVRHPFDSGHRGQQGVEW